MVQTPGEKQRLKQLSERPTVHDIQHFLTSASKETGVRFNYCWIGESGQTYTISVKHVSPTGITCEWHMYAEKKDQSEELWFHLTDNSLNIYDSMLQVLGADTEAATMDESLNTFTTLPVQSESGAQGRIRNPALAQTFDSIYFEKPDLPLTKEDNLKGNLRLVHITNLLQSIDLGQLSGRLRIQRQTVWADIYFTDGSPIHAEGSRGTGEDCLLQVICWTEGDFLFEPKLTTTERTIKRALENLILEGVLLHDHTTYLTTNGIRLNTILAKVRPDLSEPEFLKAIGPGEPLETANLKAFYQDVDGAKQLEDIIADRDLLRSQWVPIVSDLLRMNLVAPGLARKTAEHPSFGKSIDPRWAESVRQKLVNNETGMYSYESFIFLLSEYIRCSHDGNLSIMVIEVQAARTAGQVNGNLTASQAKELAFRIDEACNFKAIISHYENNDFALLLPGVSTDKATRRADRLLKSLVSTGLQSGTNSVNLVVSIGIATLPDDATDMSSLLAEAERAKEKARKSGSGLAIARRSKSSN